MEVSFRELFYRRLGSSCPNLYRQSRKIIVLKFHILFDIQVVVKTVFSLVIYLCCKIVSYKLNCQFLIFFVCRPMAVGDHDDDIVGSGWGTNGRSDLILLQRWGERRPRRRGHPHKVPWLFPFADGTPFGQGGDQGDPQSVPGSKARGHGSHVSHNVILFLLSTS
jgi:hypothetical protein